MTQFEEREKAFERAYELEEEKGFRIIAMATRDMGRWAAQKMGMDEIMVKAYIDQALEAELAKPHHVRLLAKISDDFVARGVRVSPREIGKQYETFLADCRKQVQAEGHNDAAKTD
jgi:hypothetical protein